MVEPHAKITPAFGETDVGAVLRLIRRGNQETIETLEWMLAEARRNERVDLCAWLRNDGEELAVFTGLYRADKDRALAAVTRMKQHLSGGL